MSVSRGELVAGVAIFGGFIACAWALWPPKKKKNPENPRKRSAKTAEREFAAALAAARRSRRRELAGELGQARDELRASSTECKTERERKKLEAAELRQRRRELAEACRAARTEGRERVAQARGKLSAFREGERARVAAERRARGGRVRRTAAEARAEDDDEVRRNLPPELVPVFDRVKRSIRGDKHRSRTEAFLEWAEANPDEVLGVQMESAEADVERWIAEYEGAA